MERIAFSTTSPLPISARNLRYVGKHTPRCAAQPPRRIGAVAKDMQGALQSALRARHSRVTLELPPGARLGTEKRKEEGRVGGDRELCRIISSMFEGTGLKVHALFSTTDYANLAKNMWGPLAECSIGDWGNWTSGLRKKGGFGKKRESVAHASNVDVLLVVSPTADQLNRVKVLSEKWGLDKLILLLNASTKGAPVDVARFVDEEFEPVYCYRPNPHPKWAGGVLFRKYPDDWVLCRQPPVGFLKQMLCSPERPSLDEISEALKKEGEKSSASVLDKFSAFMGNE